MNVNEDLEERLHALAAGLSVPAAQVVDAALAEIARLKAEIAAAPRMRAAILEVATLLDAWAEGERRAYCSTIDEGRKQRATVLMESYTLAARTLRDALPKEGR